MSNPIGQRDHCEYFLPAPPLSVKSFIPSVGSIPALPEPGFCTWSNTFPVPQIGETVDIKLNQLGQGKVLSCFIEHGFLGLHVALESPVNMPQHRKGCLDALVFGCDLIR